MSKLHAKSRPPSSAARWIPCPGSATVVPLYERESSIHSDKGDRAHALLEDGIIFGLTPNTDDPDMDMNIRDVMEWVYDRRQEYGSDCKVYAEQQYDIPETGEIGTCDVTFVAASIIHISDYKNGYVMTDAVEQMLLYLSGAVALYGPRPIYKVTVFQPNYNHRDGPIRTSVVTQETLDAFRREVLRSVERDDFVAGSHCKKTYCEHRGACATFLTWAQTQGEGAYYPHEVNAITDAQLAQALDHADTLYGVRDEYRKEAMRRIAQHDRRIEGYKLVKSRQQRDFAGEDGRAACYSALFAIGYEKEDLFERKTYTVGGITVEERTLLTVPGVEKMVKQKYKSFKRGTWKQIWDEHFRPHIREFSGSLTLERDTDGRPSHTRGSEFGGISTVQVGQVV